MNAEELKKLEYLIEQEAPHLRIRQILGIGQDELKAQIKEFHRKREEAARIAQKTIDDNIELLGKMELRISNLIILLQMTKNAEKKARFQKELQCLQTVYSNASIFNGPINLQLHATVHEQTVGSLQTQNQEDSFYNF